MKKYEVIVESAFWKNNVIIMENVEITGSNLLHGTVIGCREEEGVYRKCNPLDFKTSCRFTMKEFTGVLE